MPVNYGKIGQPVAAEKFVPVHLTADTYGRITMPKLYSDAERWIQGTESLQAWLLLVSQGRLRLLSDDQVQRDPLLEPVRLLVLEGRPAALTEVTFTEEPKRAALVARLLPTVVSPPGPGWRISIPKAFDIFAPSDSDAKAFSILMSLEGYLEIWYTDVLRRAGILPLP
jgi:hypothetical protein